MCLDLVIFQRKFDSSFGAVASIVIFQTSKIVLIAICSFFNSLLPSTPFDSVAYLFIIIAINFVIFDEDRHFTLFQLQISFLFYYRTFCFFLSWIWYVQIENYAFYMIILTFSRFPLILYVDLIYLIKGNNKKYYFKF